VFAQDMSPTRFVAFGGGFGDKGFGWSALGIPIKDKFISYTLFDFTPVNKVDDASFTLLNSKVMLKVTTTTGGAYKLIAFSDTLSLWRMGTLGLATTGEFNSMAYKYGGFVNYQVKPKFGIMAGVGGQTDRLNGTSLDLRLGMNFRLGQ
jgi:hypothetical protein